MSTAIKIITPPSDPDYPVSLSEAILHGKLNPGIEDDLINAFIRTATEQVESITEHRLLIYESEQYFDFFPRNRRIDLLFPPLVTVNSIKFFDEDGVVQVFAADNYWVINNSKHQGYIMIKPGVGVPALEHGRPQSIIVNFDNGYGTASADVPQTFKDAIKMFVNDLYYARRNNLENVSLTDNPTAMQVLGNLVTGTVDFVSISQFTQLSGGQVL